MTGREYSQRNPSVFTTEEKKEWLAETFDVTIGSDAFSHLEIILREHTSPGVKYVAQPGGSVEMIRL